MTGVSIVFTGQAKTLYMRLTSNQMVSQYIISFVWMHKQPIYFSQPDLMGFYFEFYSIFYEQTHVCHLLLINLGKMLNVLRGILNKRFKTHSDLIVNDVLVI